MKAILAVMAVAVRIAQSYGTFLVFLGNTGNQMMEVAKKTFEVLGQEKYKHIKAHFQQGVLHFYSAMAEFKKGIKGLETAVVQNPEDFKELMNFMSSASKQLEETTESLVKGITQHIDEIMKEGVFAKIPDFIRTSGEYMEAVNVGKVEIDLETFKQALCDTKLEGFFMIRELHKAQDNVRSKGWTSLKVENWKGQPGDTTLIYWADEFDFTDLIPEDVEIVTKKEGEELTTDERRFGDVVYKIDYDKLAKKYSDKTWEELGTRFDNNPSTNTKN